MFADKNFRGYHYNDFCSYFWTTIGSIIKVISLSICAFFITFILSLIIMAHFKVVAIIAGAIASIVALVVACGATYEHYKHEDPGFIRTSYRTFKDKTCHKLEWE
jgi:hypothetical protein